MVNGEWCLIKVAIKLPRNNSQALQVFVRFAEKLKPKIDHMKK